MWAYFKIPGDLRINISKEEGEAIFCLPVVFFRGERLGLPPGCVGHQSCGIFRTNHKSVQSFHFYRAA